MKWRPISKAERARRKSMEWMRRLGVKASKEGLAYQIRHHWIVLYNPNINSDLSVEVVPCTSSLYLLAGFAGRVVHAGEFEEDQQDDLVKYAVYQLIERKR